MDKEDIKNLVVKINFRLSDSFFQYFTNITLSMETNNYVCEGVIFDISDTPDNEPLTLFTGILKRDEGQVKQIMSEAVWGNILNKLFDEMDLLSWEKNSEYAVFDGESWTITITLQNNEVLVIEGDSASYPAGWSDFLQLFRQVYITYGSLGGEWWEEHRRLWGEMET